MGSRQLVKKYAKNLAKYQFSTSSHDAEQQYYISQQIKALIKILYTTRKIDWLILFFLDHVWLISSKNKYWDNWSVWCNYDLLFALPSCQFDQSHSQCHSDDSALIMDWWENHWTIRWGKYRSGQLPAVNNWNQWDSGDIISHPRCGSGRKFRNSTDYRLHLTHGVIAHKYHLADLHKYFYLLLKHLNVSDTGWQLDGQVSHWDRLDAP